MKILKKSYEMSIPKNVLEICEILEKNGEEAWVVGGCVRDILISKTPNDWDITTSANPDKVISLFGKSFGNGINFGIPFIHYKGETYEIAQFRKDLNCDGRHCETMVANGINEDLLRRDFTINAIAYRPITKEIAYPETSLHDLDNKIIRCVGNAKERFQEDALRVLRMYRFAATLNFDIEIETRMAAKYIVKENMLKVLSGERIKKEFTKILISEKPSIVLFKMKEDGTLGNLFPELTKTFDFEQKNLHHCYNVFEHLVETVDNIPNSVEMRYAALFHDIAKPTVCVEDKKGYRHFPNHAHLSLEMVEPILRRLTFDNESREKVLSLINYHDTNITSFNSMKKFCSKHGVNFAREIIVIRRADVLSQSMYQRFEKLSMLDDMLSWIEQIELQNSAITLKSLNFKGKDLIALGLKPSPKFSEILQTLLDEVLDDKLNNTYEDLLVRAKEMITL